MKDCKYFRVLEVSPMLFVWLCSCGGRGETPIKKKNAVASGKRHMGQQCIAVRRKP